MGGTHISIVLPNPSVKVAVTTIHQAGTFQATAGIGALLLRPWTLRRRLTVSLAAVNVLGTILFSGISYEISRRATLESIDTLLCVAAEGVHDIVPHHLVANAEMPERDSTTYAESYRTTQAELERYFEATKLEFVYVISVRPDGSAYEVVSNLSPEQKAAKIDPLKELLLKSYDPSPGMLAAAKSRVRSIDLDTDDYGSHRSCLGPVSFADGLVGIFGADMEISAVDQKLLNDLLTNFGIGGVILIVTLAIIAAISTSVARDAGVAVQETKAISRLELEPTGIHHRSAILEVDNLFGALRDMKGGLSAFGKFVPKSVIKQVLAAGKADVGGEQRVLSLLMTDVTDFTTITEQLEPAVVMKVMSAYFGTVVQPILEMQGTLDKYVGDAIFAYWNAPTLQSDHTELGRLAALKSRDASVRLATEWESQGTWPWHTRFGLHAGDVIVGNVGAPDRMDFTVIGASVNLASRIEGLNKFYGTEILASDRVFERVRDKFIFRSIDRVMPKGAPRDLEIFELLGTRDAFEFNPKALAQWEEACRLYRAREWPRALEIFKTWAKAHASDKPAQIYVARCRAFIADPQPPSWDGTERFQTK